MQPGTSIHHHQDITNGRRRAENLSHAALGLIENPLFERSGDRSQTGGSHSVPVSRQASEQKNKDGRTAFQKGLQRSKTVKEFVAKRTSSFFGVNSETEQDSYQRWIERRKRFLSKKYGQLKSPQGHQEEQQSFTVLPQASSYPRSSHRLVPRLMSHRNDVVDGVQSRSTVPSTSSFTHHRRKDSVYKMMWDGLRFISKISRTSRICSNRSSYRQQSFRSYSYAASANGSVFYDEQQENGLPPSQMFPDTSQIADDVFIDEPSSTLEERISESLTSSHLQLPSLHRDTPDSSRSPPYSWHRPSKTEPSPDVGMKRIWNKLLDQALDNSNRRQFGMGIAGNMLNRRFRQERITSDVRQQLDDIDDHRPFFTYWVTTVQILVTIISLAVYGFGPVGFNKTQRSGLVLVTSLSLQEVDYFEPSNFWIGPRAADLVHLGAKFTPCMRKDKNIFDSIGKDRQNERNTACCVRNDQSGCVQTSRDRCSEIISTWKKWDIRQPGPPRWTSDPRINGEERKGTHRRLSGSVCGQDPRFCQEPASVYPYEWPDDITKWPVCRNAVMGQSEPHMSCEIIGRPCCLSVHGQCQITTKEYCDFVKGFFHEEAALCSQVSCLDDVCGMIPFHNPEVPDQFYRLWTSLFLHAGIIHLLITVIIQYLFMKDLEKMTGPLRMLVIYIMSGVSGNLASAIFVPYRAEVGPAGSHFGLLACMFVEVINCWQMLEQPRIALLKLGAVALVLFLIGLLPWVDNYAHLFGFIFGFLLSYALLPFLSFGPYDRTTKKMLIWICLTVVVVLFVGLLVLFYVHPIYECSFCMYFNCIPLTTDFCEDHNIVLKRQEY